MKCTRCFHEMTVFETYKGVVVTKFICLDCGMVK